MKQGTFVSIEADTKVALRFTVKIEGLSIPLSDVNQQIKFRKALGSTIGVMFAGVIMRDITRRRGDSAMSSHGTRRAISSQSTTKVLSAGDASQLADQVNSLINIDDIRTPFFPPLKTLNASFP